MPKPPGPLAGETIWYEDSERKSLHSELVRAGMERAKQQGRQIGRPSVAAESEDTQFEESDRVTDDPGFNERFDEVVELLDDSSLSRRKTAIRLGIGYATLKRLLDALSASRGKGLETHISTE